MLVLTRKVGESIYLGDDIKLTMVRVKGGQVRVAIDAPKSVTIEREELRAGGIRTPGGGREVESCRFAQPR